MPPEGESTGHGDAEDQQGGVRRGGLGRKWKEKASIGRVLVGAKGFGCIGVPVARVSGEMV